MNLDDAKIRLMAQAVERKRCKESLFEFIKSFWDVIIKEKPVFNWHIEFLCSELEILAKNVVARAKKLYDLIINIPPGTTKSTVVTIMFPVWLWTQDPTLRIITNSYSGDLSVEHASKSKDIIESDKFKTLFPEIRIRKDKSGKGAYENTKTGARYSTSTGGTITGKHAHIIINDDPLNVKQSESDVMRKIANDHTKTLASRKVNKENTPVITIMQRLHENDVTGYLLSKKSESIRHICLPAELSDNVFPPEVKKLYINGLLDTSRLNHSVLNEARVDLGTRGYAGQYDQNPVADGGNIIKKTWFQFTDRLSFERLQERNPIVFFMDTAFTEKNENDPTGVIATCKIGNRIFISNATKVLKEFPELIKFIPNYVQAHGYTDDSTIRIEPKANGKSVVQQLRDTSMLNVTETESPSDSKITRLYSVSPIIESGRVVLVQEGWNDDFLDEICGFPNKMHDEYVDLIVYAIDYHLKQNSNQTQELAGMFY